MEQTCRTLIGSCSKLGNIARSVVKVTSARRERERGVFVTFSLAISGLGRCVEDPFQALMLQILHGAKSGACYL